jgi:hypothetical protein
LPVIQREATPLLELGDQGAPRVDDLGRLRMVTVAANRSKGLGVGAHAHGYLAAFRTIALAARWVPHSCANTAACFSRQRGPGPRMSCSSGRYELRNSLSRSRQSFATKDMLECKPDALNAAAAGRE